MLVSKRVKHRRESRGKMRDGAKGGKEVTFGEWGLQAIKSHWITSRQIEVTRIAITCHMKRGEKIWIKIFSHKSYTSKVIGVCVGKGKRAPENWVLSAKRNKIILEIAGAPEGVVREAPRPAPHKLPVKAKIVKCEEMGGESNED